MDWDHLVNEVSRIKHRNSNQLLDNELWLEQILAFLRQTLKQHHSSSFSRYFIGFLINIPLNLVKRRLGIIQRPKIL